MTSETLQRLKTPLEKEFELFLALNMVEVLGYDRWELFKTAEQNCLMQLYDDQTWVLEQQEDHPGLQAELQRRRLLTVQLRIQFREFVTQVFNLTGGGNNVQQPNQQNV